jgi:AcrR family transcriptional regulator
MSTAQQKPDKPNRMDQRRERTRQQILTAVESLVLKQGYDDTSAEAIAELADLGRSTFYNHFDNKKNAVLATITARYTRYGQDAYVPLEQTLDRRVAVAVSAGEIFRAMANDPLTRQLVDRPHMLVQALLASQVDFVVGDASDGVRQGHFKFATNLESMFTLLMWGYVGLIIKAINDDSVESTCVDWCRLLLLNLGVNAGEIEDILARSQAEHAFISP